MDDREKEIRDRLSKQLGVDFCTDEELAQEQKVAETEVKPIVEDIKDRPVAISINDIVLECRSAIQTMSAKNPNAYLLYKCAQALLQLQDRLAKYEEKVN